MTGEECIFARQGQTVTVIIAVTRILLAFWGESRGFQTHGLDKRVEIVDDTLVETIQLGSPLRIKLCV